MKTPEEYEKQLADLRAENDEWEKLEKVRDEMEDNYLVEIEKLKTERDKLKEAVVWMKEIIDRSDVYLNDADWQKLESYLENK